MNTKDEMRIFAQKYMRILAQKYYEKSRFPFHTETVVNENGDRMISVWELDPEIRKSLICVYPKNLNWFLGQNRKPGGYGGIRASFGDLNFHMMPVQSNEAAIYFTKLQQEHRNSITTEVSIQKYLMDDLDHKTFYMRKCILSIDEVLKYFHISHKLILLSDYYGPNYPQWVYEVLGDYIIMK